MESASAIQDALPFNHCWGCGPSNEGGLQIKSYWQDDEVVCEWQPGPPFFAGPTHVLNGGIIATLLDCHSVCTAIDDCYRTEGRDVGTQPDLWCVTASMDIKYLRPTPISAPVRLVATITKRGNRSRGVECTLYSEREVCARAHVVAVRVSDEWRQG